MDSRNENSDELNKLFKECKEEQTQLLLDMIDDHRMNT